MRAFRFDTHCTAFSSFLFPAKLETSTIGQVKRQPALTSVHCNWINYTLSLGCPDSVGCAQEIVCTLAETDLWPHRPYPDTCIYERSESRSSRTSLNHSHPLHDITVGTRLTWRPTSCVNASSSWSTTTTTCDLYSVGASFQRSRHKEESGNKQ